MFHRSHSSLRSYSLITFILWLFTFSLQAQSLTYDWAAHKSATYSYSDYGSIVPVASNHIYSTSIVGRRLHIEKRDLLGNVVWEYTVIGNISGGRSLVTDGNENLYLTGFFSDSLDFDFGVDTFELKSNGYSDVFILKLDSGGNFLWAGNIGGSGADIGYDIALDGSENIYVTGRFQDTADMDPGISVYNLISGGSDDIFLLKLDNSGNFRWATSMGSDKNFIDVGECLYADKQGNIYLGGDFVDTIDVDPGPGVHQLYSKGTDFFVLKLDTAGNFIWAKDIGTNAVQRIYAITGDNSGDLLISGFFTNTTDFDPGINTYDLTADFIDAFVLKLDNMGNFKWVKAVSGGYEELGFDVTTDASDFVYVTGSFYDTVDFDPGPARFNIISKGAKDVFLLKLDPNGDFVNAYTFGGLGSEEGVSVALSSLDNIFIGGRYEQSIDLDTSNSIVELPGAGTYLLKLKQDSCSNLSIIIDSVANINCNDSGFISSHAKHGIEPYSYEWNTLPTTFDSTILVVNPRNYTIKVSDAQNCRDSATIHIDGPSIGGYDLNPNLIVNNFRPGFSSFFSLVVVNESCTTTSGKVKLIVDSLITFDSASPPPNTISGDTLTWLLPNLAFDSSDFTAIIHYTLDSSAAIGDIIDFNLNATPVSGDIDPSNNIKNYSIPVVNGYDPNDKQVYPQGECLPRYVIKNQLLTYAIRFQNTGNASAINIFIIDSLDNNLDLSSLKVLKSSHEVYTEIIGGNTLKFNFDEINLPDSGFNLNQSQGYVLFELKPISGLSNDTKIENTCGIFFDNNPVVKTNTVYNTLTDSIPDITFGNDNIVACDTFKWTNGITYFTSNNQAKDTLQNRFGCDSITSLHLTLYSSSYRNDSITACDEFIWMDGLTYTSNNNSAKYFLTNSNGCDSVITLKLTINNPDSIVDVITHCDSYTWINGITYTSNNNSARDTLINKNGCDSIIHLNLSINKSDTTTDEISSCDQYKWINDSVYVSSATNEMFSTTNSYGCDSTVFLNLTILSSVSTIDSVFSCSPYTWIDGKTYSFDNNSAQMLLTKNDGCDSLIKLKLTVSEIDTIVKVNSNLLLSNQNDATYQWLNCESNYEEIEGETAQQFEAMINGIYAVEITNNNCVDTSECVNITSIGYSNSGELNVTKIFPNPTDGLVTLELYSKGEYNITVKNTKGQIVLSFENISSSPYQFFMDIDPGIYIVEVTSTDQREQFKLIRY